MSAMAFEILVILVLVIVNGVFALAEIAIVASRKHRLQQLTDAGDPRAARALALADSPGDFLSTVQVGITLVGVMAGAFGGATIAEQLGEIIALNALFAPYAETIGIMVVVVGITYVSLILGELVPKRIALGNPEKIGSFIAVPISRLARLARPVVRLLSVSSDIVLWCLRVRPAREQPVSEEEIRSLIRRGTAEGIFERAEEEMVENVFRLTTRRVGGIMTPRKRVVVLSTTDTPEAIRRTLAGSPHSRYPLCEENLDQALGVVSTKDLLARIIAGRSLDLREVVRDVPSIHESTTALKALGILEKSEGRIAFVVNEFGGIQGIVTMADVAGAVVGSAPRLEEPVILRRADGSWLVDGLLPFEELGEALSIPRGPDDEPRPYTTVGGYILARLGRIPAAGETFELAGYRVEVLDMDGLRIDKLGFSVVRAAGGSGSEAPGS